MRFEEFVAGRIYTDKDGVNAYAFIGMRNDYLASFNVCEYDEEKGDYVATQEVVYLTANEVKGLI